MEKRYIEDTCPDVVTDKIYTTSDGIRYKIKHLVIRFNISDVIHNFFSHYDLKECGYPQISDDDDINKSYINQIKEIKAELIELAHSYDFLSVYVPYFDIAHVFASHIYIEDFHSDFTLALIEAFKTFHDEIYTKVVNETMVSVGGGIGSNPSQSKKITVNKKDITQLDRDDVLYCMTENPIYLRHY